MESSRRRLVQLIGMAGLSGFAGCSQGPQGGTAATNSTTSTPTETVRSTPTPDTEFELPSGYSTDGLSDGEVVKQAHVSSLSDTAYSVDFFQAIETPNNEYDEQFDLVNKRGHIEEVNMGAEWFFDDTVLYVKRPPTEDDGEVSYSTSEITEDGWRSLAAGVLDFRIFSRLGQYDYEGPEYTREGGQRLAVFDITGDKSGRVKVSPTGTIDQILVEESGERLIDYETTHIGETSIEEPDWVSDVETATPTPN